MESNSSKSSPFTSNMGDKGVGESPTAIYRGLVCRILVAAGRLFPACCLLTVAFCLLPAALSAQTYWMQKAGSITDDEAYSISTDDSDNTYTTGYFTGTASFGPANLTALGVSDIFITKVNSAGVFQWTQRGGGAGDADRGLAIVTDANNGNSYVTGYFYGTAHFGLYSITSNGLQDIFVAKYDRNGNVQWVVSGGGTQSDIGNAIALDNNGNVIVTGQFAGTAILGTFTLTSTANNINVFTAKLNGSNGNFIWAKSGVGPHTDRGLGVACDPTGNVYITGQFTDTITFDAPHRSPLYNAIFIVKYNSLGTEQWITTAGGGTYNIANAIAVDNSSNVYITGNFTGTLTFFAQSNITLTNIYTNRIFIAKYNQNANLTWEVADGSSNNVTSNALALDASGNPYITGNFECIFNGYADQYGQGTFNSVGLWDIFAAEYSSSNGAWQWSRQIGGHGNNYGNAIAVSSVAKIFTAGSFDQDAIVPMDNNFYGCSPPYQYCPKTYCNNTYCSDNYYGEFGLFNTVGGLDILIAQPIDLNRQPYDFYIRKGNGCNRPQEGACINDSSNSGGCQDTVKLCGGGTLYAHSITCNTISPDYSYKWLPNSRITDTIVHGSGWYYVTQTSAGGCFISKDSVYVIIHSDTNLPCISDNVVINSNNSAPIPIRLCNKSVVITGCINNSDFSWHWTTPRNIQEDSASITLKYGSDTGLYCFTVLDSFGCPGKNNCVIVAIDTTLKKIIPKLLCETCHHDSVFLCENGLFFMYPYDSLSNPTAVPGKCIPETEHNWIVKPNMAIYANLTGCPESDNAIVPLDSGWYHITDSIRHINACGDSLIKVSDSVFVRLYPFPVVNLSIIGKPLLCPGDSEWIVAFANTSYRWSTGSTNDSIYVGVGNYSISASVTSSHGCTTKDSTGINISNYTIPAPYISLKPPGPAVICPNDSLKLACIGGSYQHFQWYGPSGPFGGDSANVYIKTPGNYYCLVSDSVPCRLSAISNTFQVENYATPFISYPPNLNLCPGDSIVLIVNASNGAIIQWLPPLSGNFPIEFIKQAGTYSVSVTSCGITTTQHVTITASFPFADISVAPSTALCNSKDSAILTAAPGMATYLWSPGNTSARILIVKTGGTYTLVAADSFGCTATDSVTIYPPVKDSVISLKNVSCSDSSNGNIIAGVSGGSGMYSYLWSQGGTSLTISGLSAGIYNLNVTDTNGCAATLSVIITKPTGLKDSIPKAGVCVGNPVTISDISSGGTYPYRYVWNTGATTSSTTVNPSVSAEYSVTVTDTNGCYTKDSAMVYVNLYPAATICCDSSIVLGEEVQLTSSGTPSPPNGGWEYYWEPQGNLSCDNCPNPVASPIRTTTYTVIITSDSGCSVIRTVTIDVGCGEVFVPDAFSPNESVNNILYVRGPCIETLLFEVFDRWGNRVFETHTTEIGWNGVHNGLPMNTGTYIWYLKATLLDGTTLEKKGNVALIR